MLDVDAPIVPGESAAGFRIGQSFEEVRALLGPIPAWEPANGRGPIHLHADVANTPGWISFDDRSASGLEFLHYGRGMLSLVVDSGGRIAQVTVGAGYRGLAWQDVGVGMRLDRVLRWTGLEYDTSDEMHYPDGASAIEGIGFVACRESLEQAPDQLIEQISIYDFSFKGDADA
jgi:hypothetical protein